jgi:hypothetical protein
MKRLELLLPLLVAALLSPAFAGADDTEGYCKTGPNSPECYCLAQPQHASELKCLRFLGANPGFSSKGAGTSATFNSGAKAPAPTVQASPALERPSDYILFIHQGAASDVGNPPNVSSLVKKLKEDGYVVRGTDDQRDVSGSGIDYFRQEDKDAAQVIANSVNKWLEDNGKRELAVVKPRRQDVRNPPGYIGVWIFGHPAKP